MRKRMEKKRILRLAVCWWGCLMAATVGYGCGEPWEGQETQASSAMQNTVAADTAGEKKGEEKDSSEEIGKELYEENEAESIEQRETVGPQEEDAILAEVREAASCFADLYQSADKGEAVNAVIAPETIHAMADRLGGQGYAASCDRHDRNMDNWETVDAALERASQGETASAVVYVMASYGGFHRYQMDFQDEEMTLTTAEMDWSKEGEPYLSYLERIRVYHWEYTEKGWLILEKEPSKNMEMDQHLLLRVKPLAEEDRRLCERYVEPVGYSQTNLFLTDWSAAEMGELALNDAFGVLYHIQLGQMPPYGEQVPAREWERVMTDFLPFSAEELRTAAGYTASTDTYPWKAAGYGSASTVSFLPFPEVVAHEEKEEGILVLTVEGVSKEEGLDCAFAHEVTLQTKEDGSWKYLGNRLVSEKMVSVPPYRPRSVP